MQFRIRKDLFYLFLLMFPVASFAFLISALIFFKLIPTCHLPPVKAGRLYVREGSSASYNIAKEGFFYVADSGSATAPPGKVSKRRPSLSLMGTVVCSECMEGMAIINIDGKVKVYRVGSDVDGYRLVGVSTRCVKLFGYGETVDVCMNVSGMTDRSSVVRNVKAGVYRVKRSKVIGEISSGRFLKYINIVPHFNVSGDVDGMLVKHINPKSFIWKLGIMPGDVILSINGVSLRSPESSFAAFERLKNEDVVVITVSRQGVKKELVYELE